MRLAIYGRGVEKSSISVLEALLGLLRNEGVYFSVEENFLQNCRKVLTIENVPFFSSSADLLQQKIQVLISLGGDGTLLDTLKYIKATDIAVMGINLGRLGFLANTQKNEINESIKLLLQRQFKIEKRTLLELQSEDSIFTPLNFALNDFTVHKRDTGSMISIDTYLNGEFFTTYWADGIIVATPTGSTAYSLSCGGPIIFPDSNSFVITPVAPHNLNIRPIIVSDSTVISFRVRGRGTNHLISLDARYEAIEYMKEIAIQKANFFFNLVKLNGQNFIYTLREKLKWGLDSRNS